MACMTGAGSAHVWARHSFTHEQPMTLWTTSHQFTRECPKTSFISASLAYAWVPNLFRPQHPITSCTTTQSIDKQAWDSSHEHPINSCPSAQSAHTGAAISHAPTAHAWLLCWAEIVGFRSAMPYSHPLALLAADASPLKIGSFQEHQNYIKGLLCLPRGAQGILLFPQSTEGLRSMG